MKNKTEKLESNSKQFFYKWKFLLFVTIIVGFLLRLFFSPWDVPVTNDALDYLAYAMAISNNGGLPIGNYPTNDGWPILISWFFTILSFQNFIDASNFQILLSTVLSSICAIPIFLICRKFVKDEFAIVGSTLFILHPIIIKNSVSGLTEPLYMLLLSLSIIFLISGKNKNFFIAFFLIGLASIVRYEAFLFIIPFSIMIFFEKKINKKSIMVFFISLLIFSSIIICISILRIETTGEDGLVSNVISGPNFFYKFILLDEPKIDEQGIPDLVPTKYGKDFTNKSGIFLSLAITNFILLLGKTLLPLMIILVPFGIYYFLKNRDKNSWFLIMFSVISIIPILYVLGRDVSETRYFLVLFPLLCVISSYSIQKISKKLKSQKIPIYVILIVIFSSIILVNQDQIDLEEERKLFDNAIIITSFADGVNYFSSSKYIEAADLKNTWPKIPEFNKSQNPNTKTAKFSVQDYESLEEFIMKNVEYDIENDRNGLTHIIIDEFTESNILLDLQKSDEKYEYLKKLEIDFQSDEQKVIIYEINLNRFEGEMNGKSLE